MSWLVDSDVLSQPAKKAGNARVISWLEKHQDQCYTSSIVIAQLAFWVRTKRGKQRIALQRWLMDLIDAMHGRILGFNASTAHIWAELQHQFQAAGKPMPVEHSYMVSLQHTQVVLSPKWKCRVGEQGALLFQFGNRIPGRVGNPGQIR